jgi:hypothetical protein
MDEISAAKARLEAARQEVVDAEQAMYAAVRAALERGEKVAAIAELLDITRVRVYQIRDGRR